MTAEVVHTHADHKHEQAGHFDHIGTPEFEIHRPHGDSRLYRFLMSYKFRRAVDLLPWPLVGRRALTVCCGSGMDAEFLERAGAAVVALDISHGALLRARERARIYGLHYRVVLGDAAPERAISEMARVAREGVVITEPADAAVTKLAIALRLIPAREEAGNLVVRFEAGWLRGLFARLGFPRLASARYLVKYGHPPAGWWRLLDGDLPFALVRAGFLLLGVRLLGRFGNKLSVAAARAPGTVALATRSRPADDTSSSGA